MRWGDWRISRVIQVHVHSAAIYEDYREQCLTQGEDPTGQMPMHFSLEDSMHYTALSLLRHRDHEEEMVQVTYLSLLMEALVHTPCPILRTDLIRRVYQEVDQLSQTLGLRWHGRASHFTLPLNEDAQEPHKFAQTLAPVTNLQDFFGTLKQMAEHRFQALAKGYVLYFPRQNSI